MNDAAVLLLDLHRVDIPFRLAFKHSAAERSATQSVWAQARMGVSVGVGEGCPRQYVSGEDLESAKRFFDRHRTAICGSVRNLEELSAWVVSHAVEIDANPAAWCAVELALLELFALRRGVPVETLLSLPPPGGEFVYSAVLGDSGVDTYRTLAEQYRATGFRDFKLKLSGDLERDCEKVTTLAEPGIAGLRIRVDANNLWDDVDKAANHLLALDYRFLGIEEPLPAGDFAAMRGLFDRTGMPIILDESCLREAHVRAIAGDPQRWIINVRVSKMGGVLRSLDVVRRARGAGVPIIVGAQVGETSVLTRAALLVARAAGADLLAQEGAFGTLLLDTDVAEPPLMFAKGGVLDAAAYGLSSRPGWGLALHEGRRHLRSL